MGDAFPELKAQESLISKVIKEEEEAFLRTLSNGLKTIDDVMKQSQQTKNHTQKIEF